MISRSNQMQLYASPESSELSNTTTRDSTIYLSSSHSNLSNLNPSQGPMAILWDIENCPVPSDIRPEDVAINIRMALRVHPIIRSAVTLFSAYGDFNAFPRRVREGCQRTGVKLVDVPNGRKDAADKAILVDMFLFALDNRPPSSIMLISGDVDFSPALHILGQRGYTIILVIPSGVGVSSALCNAGRFVWDWSSVARGEGFLPPPRPVMAPPRVGQNETTGGYLMGRQINDNQDGFDEEAIVYRGVSQSYYNSKDISFASQSRSEYTSGTSLALPCYNSGGFRSHSLPFGLSEATPGTSANQSDASSWWVQPGDFHGLKGQLLKLLEQSGGCMPLVRIPPEYQKLFGRPLYVSEYGACKLVNLLRNFSDVMSVEGGGQKKFVYIKNSRGTSLGATLLPPSSLIKDKKGKGFRNANEDANAVSGSSDEISDDDRVVLEGNNRSTSSETAQIVANPSVENRDPELQMFKWELEEILVSYSGKIFLGGFEAIYQQRYKRQLNYGRFGAKSLEQLLEKLQDVAVLKEEPLGKRKFVAAVGS